MNRLVFKTSIHNPEVSGSNPDLATKPVTKVTGFFNAKPRNKLAFVNRQKAKTYTIRIANCLGLGKSNLRG